MCGIAGIFAFNHEKIPHLTHRLQAMGQLLAHRGPDDQGIWTHPDHHVGLAHRRLSIIDLTNEARQPMRATTGDVIVFNGEIYNHIELRKQLAPHWSFQTQSDTEIILAAYRTYGVDCVNYFQGMFAFVIWDGEKLFIARDQFGIKPFYFTIQNQCFIFASESKAILPFLPQINTQRQAFVEYITFQYPMGEQTLFEDIWQLEPAHAMVVTRDGKKVWRYWDIHYHMDYDQSADECASRLQHLLSESIQLHLRSDVTVGAYVSGGIDSSLIGLLASEHTQSTLPFFHGRFLESSQYDESAFAQAAADVYHNPLHVCDITASDFMQHFQKIIYHLDFPVAGPGVFPQYLVSQMAAQQVKVVLGGQGGDEIFGGYARYLLAYFEQCIKAAIEGTYHQGNFAVTAESIIPQLEVLGAYKPMIKQFFSQGLFGSLEERYFTLVNRANDAVSEVTLTSSEKEHVYARFLQVYNAAKFEKAESYLDSMMHFDFKCLLPGLLHVEDRVSMAHGLEARVPFLYVPLIEFLTTIPANVKFADGKMKHLLKHTYRNQLPQSIYQRKDKMGFPVPLQEWMQTDLKTYFMDILHAGRDRQDSFIDYTTVIQHLNTQNFPRKLWGFICYEIWQQQFHDQAACFRALI